MNPSFRLLERDFFLSKLYFTLLYFSTLYLKVFYIRGNRHCYEQKPIFKDNEFLKSLFFQVETDFLASGNSGNHFLPLSHIFFKESFIPIFLLKAFFPASENHYLNYCETYLRPLLPLLKTIFFDYLDIPVNGSSFSSKRNVFLNEFSIPARGYQLSVQLKQYSFIWRSFFCFQKQGDQVFEK